MDVQNAQALAGRLLQERNQARRDALRYNQERNEARAELVALRTAFADVRAAARALSQKSRLANALSIEVRVALAAAALH